MWFMFVIPFVVFFIIFLLVAISIFKTHKKGGDTIQNMINSSADFIENEIKQVFAPKKEETKTCEYCGSTMPANSTQCNGCGAKTSSKK